MVSSLLHDLLTARETRYRTRLRVAAGEGTVVELALNVPGWPKTRPRFEAVFERAVAEARTRFGAAPIHCGVDAAGSYALFLVPHEPMRAKAIACDLEDAEPWGRLLDLDCHGANGKVSRRMLHRPERRCFVCDDPHPDCIASRRHGMSAVCDAAERLALTAEGRTDAPRR